MAAKDLLEKNINQGTAPDSFEADRAGFVVPEVHPGSLAEANEAAAHREAIFKAQMAGRSAEAQAVQAETAFSTEVPAAKATPADSLTDASKIEKKVEVHPLKLVDELTDGKIDAHDVLENLLNETGQ